MKRPFRRYYFALIFPAVLSGCVGYQPQPLKPAQTAARFEARRLSDPDLVAFLSAHGIAAPVQWDCPALTLTAWYEHPDMAVARGELASAKARLITAGGAPDSILNLGAEYHTPARVRRTYGGAWMFPLQTGGKRSARIRTAQAQIRAARYRYAQTAWRVRARLRDRVLALYHARQLQRILTSEQERLAAYARELANAGAGPLLVNKVRQSLDTARVAAANAATDVAADRGRLAAALGLPASALDHVPLVFDCAGADALVDSPDPKELVRAALQGRADLAAASADYAAAEAGLKLAVARQYPDLQLGPGYAWDQATNKWTLGLGLSLPSRSRSRGRIDEARARRSVMAAQFDRLQARIIGQVNTARARYQGRLAALTRAETGTADAREQQARILRNTGTGPFGTVARVDADLAVFRAERTQVNALAAAHRALAGLEDAVQSTLNRASYPASWLGPAAALAGDTH